MTFDYIIVGAGSAGCILANRLSADPANSVLLIEAGGPDKKMEIHIPAGYGKLHRSRVDWGGYWTEPQADLLDRRLYLPRGKTLGGCSSTNAMAYVRGNSADYDDWSAMGNPGWSYREILPYFIRSEHNEDIRNAYHGAGGELNTGFAKSFRTPFAEAFVEACVQSGFERNGDYNGEKQEGAGFFQFNIKNGKRHSAATAFLKPVLRRPNLKVFTHTHTRRVLLQKDRATGVEVATKSGEVAVIYAKKEVILSAGSFASPQLLMLSGIGEAAELKKHGIECLKDLPGVGKNLQDHLFFAVSASASVQQGQNHHLKPVNQLLGLLKYAFFKTGVFTSGPLEAVAFGSTDAGGGRVDYQFQFAPLQIGADYSVDMYDLNTFPHEDGFSILPTLLRPESRGALSLRSADPMDFPVIQPNFLASDNDKMVLINGARKALDVLQAPAFDPFRKQLLILNGKSTDDAIFRHIQQQAETVYHPVGTCKMGVDEMAVTDPILRVRGVEGLRVIDGSVMPAIVSGNTNAPVYMIAEKGADLILKDG